MAAVNAWVFRTECEGADMKQRKGNKCIWPGGSRVYMAWRVPSAYGLLSCHGGCQQDASVADAERAFEPASQSWWVGGWWVSERVRVCMSACMSHWVSEWVGVGERVSE